LAISGRFSADPTNLARRPWARLVAGLALVLALAGQMPAAGGGVGQSVLGLSFICHSPDQAAGQQPAAGTEGEDDGQGHDCCLACARASGLGVAPSPIFVTHPDGTATRLGLWKADWRLASRNRGPGLARGPPQV
jgi:hypothetical protein